MSRFPFMDQQEERDLNEVVRKAAQSKPLPKKFYKLAEAVAEENGFTLKLDGRNARTPARNLLQVPDQKLAEAIAAEWNGQGEVIDPDLMPHTRIVNSALDGVADRRMEVIDDLVRYAGSDLVCYRADSPEKLVEAQSRAWDPVLSWCRNELGAQFTVSDGLMHVAQPQQATDAVSDAVRTIQSPVALAAFHVMTTLSGSVLIPLAHIRGALSADGAWDAAHVDELYQEAIWGVDEEAARRRDIRQRDFKVASTIFSYVSE